MTARLIDGTAIGKKIRESVRQKILQHTGTGRRAPCLAVLLVGDDPASQVYVRHKEKACAEAGITSKTFKLPGDVPQADVLNLIKKLNDDEGVDGILPQLPMPSTSTAWPSSTPLAPVKTWTAFHFTIKAALRGISLPCVLVLQQV